MLGTHKVEAYLAVLGISLYMVLFASKLRELAPWLLSTIIASLLCIPVTLTISNTEVYGFLSYIALFSLPIALSLSYVALIMLKSLVQNIKRYLSVKLRFNYMYSYIIILLIILCCASLIVWFYSVNNFSTQLVTPIFIVPSHYYPCLLYTSPSPRDLSTSRMPSSA